MRVITNKKIIRPDIIGHASDGFWHPPVTAHHFKLPRNKSPYFAFLLLSAACLFAAAQFYQPAAPAIVAPAVAAPIAPPAIETPPKPEIDEIARLLPEAASLPLPIKPLPSREIESRPHIIISKPKAEASSAKLVRQGIELAKAGQPAAALDAFNQARKLNPKDPAVLYNIAVLNDRMGDSEEALKYYKASLRTGMPANASLLKRRIGQLTAEMQQD